MGSEIIRTWSQRGHNGLSRLLLGYDLCDSEQFLVELGFTFTTYDFKSIFILSGSTEGVSDIDTDTVPTEVHEALKTAMDQLQVSECTCYFPFLCQNLHGSASNGVLRHTRDCRC